MKTAIGKQRSRCFAAIAAVHFGLTLAFIARVPLRYAPDEGPHWGYVRHLAVNHALPVFGAEGATYEAHQPPLYYLICVPAYLVTSGIGADATVVACRVVSAIAGLANLLFIWLGAREVFRGDSVRPLMAAAFCALLPMNLYVNSAVSNDALAGMMASLTLWWLLRCCGRGFDEKSALIAGALAGVAMLCKMNAMFLVPVAAIGVFVSTQRAAKESPRAVRLAGLSVLTALVISGPWLARNSWLYGDPLAWRAFKENFHNPSPQEMMAAFGLSPLGYIGKVALLTWATFWGMFGEVNSAWLRMGLFRTDQVDNSQAGLAESWLAAFLMVFVAVGWVKSLGQRIRAKVLRGLESHILMMATLLVVTEFVQFNFNYFQAQARYLHMALLPISAALIFGFMEGSRIGKNCVLVACVMLLSLVVLDLTIWQPILVVLPNGSVQVIR